MFGSRRHVFSHREVLLSFFALVAACVLLYGGLWLVDFAGRADAPGPLELFRSPGAVGTLSNLGEVTVAVLGVALTVVTIIVELASTRYTPRITELFIRDPINAVMMGFYVITAVTILWVEMSLYGGHHPQAMVLVAIGFMSVSLLSLLPYFAYVFDFLLPTRVVTRIEQRGASAIRRVARQGARAIGGARDEVLTGIEQLGDIALNSVEHKDKNIAIAALSALTDLAEANAAEKPRLIESWFATDELVESDQDFIAMHPDVVRALTARRTWVEMKILRQYQAIFEESLLRMRDISHLIAIHTRRLATLAAGSGDQASLELSLRFMNTYMRSTLNARDQRSAYNLLNEYRALGEALLGLGRDADVLVLAERCKFYGQLAFALNLPFILETAAYDLCGLLERAWRGKASCHDALLAIFVDVDRRPEGKSAQEASLRGVRKAQVKLATFYLAQGDEPHARRIFEDMQGETPERLRSIRSELSAIVEAEWWEVSDRGVNFEYLPPDRRAQLDTFFAWFDVRAVSA